MNCRVLCVTDRSDLPETELFIRLSRAGVDIEVACNPTGRYYERLKASGVPVHDMIIKSRFSPKSIGAVKNLLKSRTYDILYCFNNKAASNVLLATGGKNCRIITYRGTVGNISFLSPASWTTHLHPRVNRIVCVSKAVREHLINMRSFGMRIRPERAVAIYKGHDLEWYQSQPADLTSAFGIPADAFTVAFAGRNRPHKGIAYLVEAARFLPPDASIHFLLLGRLTDDKSLQRRIRQSPYYDRIHLTGFRDDAPAVFAACNAFVMPSTRREGLSRAVIEAMAYGTAPIVTDVGGLPELVVDGQSGYVVPPENAEAIAGAIMKLYANRVMAEQMGQNARERIRTTFHIDNTVAETRAMFENLMRED